jgi:hypothetical protein
MKCRSLMRLENNLKNGFCWKRMTGSSCIFARTRTNIDKILVRY